MFREGRRIRDVFEMMLMRRKTLVTGSNCLLTVGGGMRAIFTLLRASGPSNSICSGERRPGRDWMRRLSILAAAGLGLTRIGLAETSTGGGRSGAGPAAVHVDARWSGMRRGSAVLEGAALFHVGIDGFSKVSDAIDAVSPKGRVTVEPGNYRETLVIRKPVSLVSNGSGIASATLYPGTHAPWVQTNGSDYGTSIITIASGGVTIDGFILDGDNPLLGPADYTASQPACLIGAADVDASFGIRSDGISSGITIQNNTFRNFSWAAVELWSSSGALSGNFVSSNQLSNILSSSSPFPAGSTGNAAIGISLRHDFQSDVSLNTIPEPSQPGVKIGIQLADFSAAPISAWEVHDNTIAGCTDGVRAWGTAPLAAIKVKGGSIGSCGIGVLLTNTVTELGSAAGAAELTVDAMTLDGSLAGAFATDGGGSGGAVHLIVRNGSILRNGTVGAGANGTNASLSMTSCEVTGNTGSGVSTGGGAALSAAVCRIVGNALGASAPSGTISAENNWWGCNAGPGSAGCDGITGAVDADPWLQVRIIASPSTIGFSESTALTADLTRNSAAADTSSFGFVPPTGLTFHDQTPSLLTPASDDAGFTASGARVKNYSSASTAGIGKIDGTVDSETVTADVLINPTDLSITKSDAPNPVPSLQPLTYTLTITNTSASYGASGVAVVDTLPAGVSFGTATPSQGSCSQAAGVVTCSLGAIAAQANATVTIVVTPMAGSVGTILNTATVSSATPDTNSTNNTATATTTVTANANLSVTKSALPSPVIAGDVLTYTVTVSNAGPNAAAAVTLTDTLPPGTTLVSASATAGGSCGSSAGTVTCSLGTISAGGSVVVTITVKVVTGGPVSISNTANVSSPTLDLLLENNSAATLTNVTDGADLQVTKSAAAAPPGGYHVGDSITYTLGVSHLGGNTAEDVRLVDLLPANFTFLSVDDLVCTYVASAPRRVSCFWPALDYADARTVHVVLRPEAAAAEGCPGFPTCSIPNTATVQALTIPVDPITSNNTASTSVQIHAGADLGVTKTDSPDPVSVGNPLTYTVVVTNYGPSSATSVALVDTLPPSVTFSSVTPGSPVCTQSGASVSCNWPSLASGASITVTIVVQPTVAAGAAGNVTNSVVVSSAVDEPNPDTLHPNSATQATTVHPKVTLTTTKSHLPSPAVPGQPISFQVTVSNSGPDDLIGGSVTDSIPAAFLSPGWTCGASAGSGCSSSGSGNISDPVTILAGGSLTYSISALVDPSVTGSVANTVQVNVPAGIDVAGTSSAIDTVVFNPSSDLSVSKSALPSPVSTGALLTYSVTISNAGPSTALGVTLSDTFDTNSPFVGFVGTPSCSQSAGIVTCNWASLLPGASQTISFQVRPNSAAGSAGSVTNQAGVSASSPLDPVSANNTATLVTPVNTAADLQLTKSGFPGTVAPGQAVTYTVTVTNLGGDDANDVRINDPIPANMTFVSAPGCTIVSGAVRCYFPLIAAGDSRMATIRLSPTVAAGGTTITNTATVLVLSPPADPVSSNNTASAQTVVLEPADLGISISDVPDPVPACSDLTYTITATNAGPFTGTGVTVTDVLPANVVFVSAVSTIGTCVNVLGTVTCSIGTLFASGPGSSATIALVARPSLAGPLSNAVSISGISPDNVPGNNSATTSTTVNPPAAPVVTPSGPTTFCAGGSVTLDAGAGFASYLWSPGGQTTRTTIVNASGSYSVQVVYVDGCLASSAPVAVTVNSLPSPAITGALTACVSTTLVAQSGFSSYQWNLGAVPISGATGSSHVATSSGSYTVTVTDGNGCSNTSPASNVTVNPLPAPAITPSGPTTFCAGSTVTLDAGAGYASYLWSPGGETTQTILVSASGSFGVTVTNGSGCSNSASPAVVTVNPLPAPAIALSGPATFCAGGTVTLDAGAGYASYLWSPGGETTRTILASASGSYGVTVTDGNGCSSPATPVTVTVYALPAPVITPSGATTFCAGGSVTLDAGAGYASYLWSPGGETTRTILVFASGSYGVTVTNGSGCSASASPVVVTVNPLPAPAITPSGSTTFCAGGTVTLDAGAGYASYLWSPGGETTRTIVVSASGSFGVTVTNGAGCSNSAAPVAVTVNSLPAPAITPSGPTTLCAGGTVTLDAGAGYASYLWSPGGAATRTILVSATGSYSVSVTDGNGCAAASPAVGVTVNPLPSPVITGTFSDCATAPLTTGAGFSSYQWNRGGVPIPGANSSSYGAQLSGNYTVTVVDSNGCVGTSLPVTVTIAGPGPVGNSHRLGRIGSNSMLLTWGLFPSADNYKVWRDTDPGGSFGSLVGTTSGSVNGFDISLSGEAPTVFYAVQAFVGSCGGPLN